MHRNPYFLVVLNVFRSPNEQRIRHLRSSLYDFPFSLEEGLSPNVAIFLGQTPTASEGALLCDFLPQLHARRIPVIRMKFPSSPLSFSSWREARIDQLLGQAVLSCLGDVGGSSL